MHAAEAAASRGDSAESALLAQFAKYELPGADAHREPQACSLASLASVMPGGDGDGLRLYSYVLVPANGCTFDEVRDAAFRDKLRDHRGLPCVPSSIPKEYFAPGALAASEPLVVVSPTPPGMQAPI